MQIFKMLQSLLGINAQEIRNEVEVQSCEIDVTQFNVPIQKFDWLEFFEPDIFRNWTEELKNSLTRKEKDLWSLT